MKVCYLISAVSSDNTGRGGHYESLKILAESIYENGLDVEIVSLGDIFPPTFGNTSVKVRFIQFKKSDSLIQYIKKVADEIYDISPNVIHSFDNKSYFFARLANVKIKCKLVLTKPGGPNPKLFFPRCNDLIVFSQENFAFFKSRSRYKDVNVHYLPNRAKKILCDDLRIREIKELYDISGKVILRIARICDSYKESFIQLINLVNGLNDQGFSCTAVIIGFIQDQHVYDEIIALDCKYLRVVTEERYTKNASALIDLCDYFLGTGRGVFEAALLNKLVFTTISSSRYPVIIDEDNIDELQHNNFSPRSILKNRTEASSKEFLSSVIQILSDEIKLNEKRKYILSVAKQRFDISSVMDSYMEIYLNCFPFKRNLIFDIILNSLVVLKVYALLKLSKNKKAKA
ncbi:hypothetical protein [Rheinheimera sp.]|uniref:hypothetical protein n=1 Tax=Rheinheimera sp. TaxID=1869214 RepID=UPI00307E5B46